MAMRSLGVSLQESELRDLRTLALGDGRSVSWLLRVAVQGYLKTRKDDVRRYEVQRVMEHLAEQSDQGRAQEKEGRLVQEVGEKAAAAGIETDPERIRAAIEAAIASTVKKLESREELQSSDSSEPPRKTDRKS